MHLKNFGVRLANAAAALAMSSALTLGPARADDAKFVMKISLPTINEVVHLYSKHLAARVDKDSDGRIKTEVYPASQLGSIPRQIEGTQFGSIQCAIIPPEFFVGVDERFEVLAAPGLVTSMANGQRLTADPEVLKLMLGLGANKGLHGAGLFVALPSYIVSKTAIRHLDDFKGKKLRVLASDFQTVPLKRLGATPVAMTLGDVLPAIQQGAIDGAISGMTVFTSMQYQDAAKYVTKTGQPYIFIIAELSSKWLATLPPDLQKIVENAVGDEAKIINTFTVADLQKGEKDWVAKGGELIELPPADQSSMLETFAATDEEVAGKSPALAAAYKLVSEAAKRDR